eukprot:PLAT2013.1.p1 GENE.PLAT2013.1~~PLAT2013.1.p1  ORF type:complete len:182 (-),score=80.23 PLAT2013.1:119-664(-)
MFGGSSKVHVGDAAKPAGVKAGAEEGGGDERPLVRDLLTDAQIEELKEAFALFDRAGRGSIDAENLGHVLRSLGQSPTDEEVVEMIKQVDLDGNGSIDFNEFLAMMAAQMRDSDSPDDLRAACRLLECPAGGIPLSELVSVLRELEEDVTEEEMEDIIAALEPDEEGNVVYDKLQELVFAL